MQINRNNYEAYFLDYRENNLSPEQVAELMIFLEQNPDLKASFEAYENIELATDKSIKFAEKESLKKSYLISTDHINHENYEETMLAKLEGDISENENIELIAFMELNPKLKLEYNLLRSAFLKPDESIIYSDKESLKKRGIFVLYKTQLIYGLSLAASIIILLGSYFGFLKSSQQTLTTEREKTVLSKIEIVQPEIMETDIVLTEIEIRKFSGSNLIVINENIGENRIADNTTMFTDLKPCQTGLIKISENELTIGDYIESREIESLAFNDVYINEIDKSAGEKRSFFRRFIVGITGALFNTKNPTKKSFFEYTLDGYNLISDREVTLEKEVDETGKVVAYNLNGNKINLSRSKRGVQEE